MGTNNRTRTYGDARLDNAERPNNDIIGQPGARIDYRPRVPPALLRLVCNGFCHRERPATCDSDANCPSTHAWPATRQNRTVPPNDFQTYDELVSGDDLTPESTMIDSRQQGHS